MVSGLSVFLSGSNSTRLLRHGMAGHTVEIVEVSWIEKPWGRSSRSVSVNVPPALGLAAPPVFPVCAPTIELPTTIEITAATMPANVRARPARERVRERAMPDLQRRAARMAGSVRENSHSLNNAPHSHR